MTSRHIWSRILYIVGGVAFVLGIADPLEGSLVILAGSALIALGAVIGKQSADAIRFWCFIFLLILFGVAWLWILSAWGGMGGPRGHSYWWGLLILPYLIGWILGVARGLTSLITFARTKRHAVQA